MKKLTIETATDYEHQKAKEYLTGRHKGSKNSPITIKMTALKHICKVLHQQNPLAIPCGEQTKKLNR
jgi:hypothetical protein